MPFQNREEAAERLADALSKYKGKNPLILAIPRGAMPMAKIIAEHLGGEVDVVLVHKLGAPGQPELAIGALDEGGYVYLHPYAKELQISQDYLEREKNIQLEILKERRQNYTPHRSARNPEGRIVIIVDDGIATGSTMMAALHAVREKKPEKLIAAVGVAPPETAEKLKNFADEVICLETPESFYAVGQFFEDFSQVSDEEVLQILSEETENIGPSKKEWQV